MKTRLEMMSVKPLTRFALNLLMGLGIVTVLAQSSIAQVTNSGTTVDPFKDTQSNDALSNLFNNRSDTSGTTSSVFDLIQRLSGSTNQADFQAQQQQNLNDAAADFRAKQQLILRQQQGVPASTQVAPPATIPTAP